MATAKQLSSFVLAGSLMLLWCSSVQAQCAIRVVSPPAARVGAFYEANLQVVGGQPPYTVQISAFNGTQLPAGLDLVQQPGKIFGTPLSAGVYPNSLWIRDANGCINFATLVTFVVSPASCPAISVTPQSITAATAGEMYATQFVASGGAPPYTFNLAQGVVVPSGISLSTAGLLGGVSAEGAFSSNLAIVVTDRFGCATVQQLAVPPVNVPALSGTGLFALVLTLLTWAALRLRA